MALKQQEDAYKTGRKKLGDELRDTVRSSAVAKARAVIDRLSPQMHEAAQAGRTSIWVDHLDPDEVKALKDEGLGVVPPPTDDMRGTCSGERWQVWWAA